MNKQKGTGTTGDVIYDKQVIDFIAVAVEFCTILENETETERMEWIERMLKILPLLYVKATLLPETVPLNDAPPAEFVREEDYVRVANRIANIMGEEDIYLDVFVEDMKYSDMPVSATVSENIADIYQDVRNFVSVYQFELADQMQDAIYFCKENFRLFWGQKLVNVLRPLHALRSGEGGSDSGEDELNRDELWD